MSTVILQFMLHCRLLTPSVRMNVASSEWCLQKQASKNFLWLKLLSYLYQHLVLWLFYCGFQSPRPVLSREKKLPSESDIEKYAQDNLNIHKKGIFRKKFSVRDMLSWSKVSLICLVLESYDLSYANVVFPLRHFL